MDTRYTKLPSNHYRLLGVVPGAHNRDLRFRFVDVAPNGVPEYTAISYTWGNEAPTEVIYINDTPFHIRPNLWACLHCLRQSWKYIWADAICINQNNTIERNEQVRNMGNIYAKAKIVSVWLGLVPMPEWLVVRGPVVTLEVDDLDWRDSLSDLASRPYWSRSWVVQEFLLASDIHLYCSNTRVDYIFFQDMLLSATDLQLGNVDVDLLMAKPELVRKWPALPLVVQRDIGRFPELYQPLYDLLVSHADTQSKDPRDKVFSLLGLVPSEERAHLQRSFPDYDLSEEQVNIVTLGHLRIFAPGKSLRPIFRALNISTTESPELSRLLYIIDKFDYLSDTDPAQQVRQLLEFYCPETIRALDIDRLALYTTIDDPVLPDMTLWLDESTERSNSRAARRWTRRLVVGVFFLAAASVLYLTVVSRGTM